MKDLVLHFAIIVSELFFLLRLKEHNSIEQITNFHFTNTEINIKKIMRFS